jgi:3-deoxy-D-arabino-heptulosonate 7-phosphate (DAHP) synthase
MKSDGNWGYLPDYSHQNYTQRFHRQSRITGTWSESRKQDKIPVIGYVIAVLAVGAFWLANFL